MDFNRTDLAQKIDHTLLKPNATEKDIRTLCVEAMENNFYSVCVLPNRVALATDLLRGSKVKVCAVAGFPLGANLTGVKAWEAEHILADGGSEVEDRKSTRLNSSHIPLSRMPSSA